MFDHVAIHVVDLAASERFYRTVLAALGIESTHVAADRIEWDDFHVVAATSTNPATRHLHVGFVAPSREQVDEFWRVGIDAGYEDDGPPGDRPQYTPNYYGAFLRDPDGNSAEAVRHDFVAERGHIDHLWIRVRDLDATSGFYVATMRHTGLSEGRRWPQGRQFRGASATFSLVADGGPVTEHLQVAFPAPNPQAVDDFHWDAIAIGCKDAGVPGERFGPGGYSFAAAVLDPSGTRVESVFRQPR
jgi:catechol 2,3-dioxygenase-like lactoylglutathione lyase family enzyme